LFTSLLGISPRANAGDLPIGLIDSGESSSSAGDNFAAPGSSSLPQVQGDLRSVITVSRNADGQVTVAAASPAVQDRINQVANSIRTNAGEVAGEVTPGTGQGILVIVLATGAEAAQAQLSQDLQDAGLSAGDTKALMEAISSMLPSGGNVNLTQLNKAINLLNRIVNDTKKSNPAVANKLLKNNNIRQMSKLMKELRVALR
jgi:hypothetical protein